MFQNPHIPSQLRSSIISFIGRMCSKPRLKLRLPDGDCRTSTVEDRSPLKCQRFSVKTCSNMFLFFLFFSVPNTNGFEIFPMIYRCLDDLTCSLARPKPKFQERKARVARVETKLCSFAHLCPTSSKQYGECFACFANVYISLYF